MSKRSEKRLLNLVPRPKVKKTIKVLPDEELVETADFATINIFEPTRKNYFNNRSTHWVFNIAPSTRYRFSLKTKEDLERERRQKEREENEGGWCLSY